MTEPTDIDALIEQARATVNRGWFRADYPSLASIITHLADALLSATEELRTQKALNLQLAEELRQGRERADEAEAYAAHALADRAEAQADLARAQEVVEKAHVPGYSSVVEELDGLIDSLDEHVTIEDVGLALGELRANVSERAKAEKAHAPTNTRTDTTGHRELRECAICGEKVTASNATEAWEKRHEHLTPTDDEREALATLLDELHGPWVTEGGCDFHGWAYGWRPGIARRVNADVVDPILTSLRRSEVLEPQGEHYDEGTFTKVYDALVKEGYATTEVTDMVNAMQNAGILFRERGPEPQGEPTDAQVDAALDAWLTAVDDCTYSVGAMRAALRAAGEVK